MMARQARLKSEGGGWYHLYGRAACGEGELPLGRPGAARRLSDIIKHYANGFYCDVAAFCVLGTHYHLLIRFHAPRPVSQEELRGKAAHFYPHSAAALAAWGPAQWERFSRRLFDVSEFMRNVQQAYARWHNRRFRRKGDFWAGRFKSTILDGPQAVADCMFYVELNAVRAGLVARPEDWAACSLHFREIGQGGWLLPLSEVFGSQGVRAAEGVSSGEELPAYKAQLYYRGEVPTRHGQARIPEETLQAEKEHGFQSRGIFRKRLRYFTDGLVLGGQERVETWLSRMRAGQRYLRRRKAISHLDGRHFTLREQRSHFIRL